MSAIILWFCGVWIAAFSGAALVIVGFDTWLNYRREARSTKGEAQ